MNSVYIRCKAHVWSFDCDVQCCTATIAEGTTFDFEITEEEGFVSAPDPRYPTERVYCNFDFDVALEIPATIRAIREDID